MMTLYTFGDSILDCGHYNEHGLDPGGLLVRNGDDLFPEFRGADLSSRTAAALDQRARDGSTVADLPAQAAGLRTADRAIALITVGGNDIIADLGNGAGVAAFATRLDDFVRSLPIRPVLLGNVYDPSFGDDANNFLGADPRQIRAAHGRVNDAIHEVAGRYGLLVDLHAHFLTGDASWFTRTIEPSLRGASEVRRCFLPYALRIVEEECRC